MPPVIVAVAAAAGAVAVGATVATAVAIAAVSLAVYSSSQARKMGDAGNTSPSPQERKQMFRSANAPKQVVLGESEVSGPIVFAQEQGTPNDSGEGELINLVVPVAGHTCVSCEEVRVGDRKLARINGGSDSSYWRYRSGNTNYGEAWFYSRPNGASGAPNSLKGVSQWDNAMIGENQSFLHVRLRSDNKQWPGGIEDVVAKVRGAQVFDPRDGLFKFTDNPALQGLHYIRHYLQVPAQHILLDTFIQAANICDEQVTRGGKNEKRFRCDPTFDEETDPKQVLGNIAACMAGEFIRSGGLWGARAGAYYGPATRTLTMNEVVEGLDIRVSQPLQDRVNTITGQYFSPEHGYNLTDFPSVTRSAYINEDGRERVEDLKLDFVQSVTQAQALAWIILEQRRRGATVTGTFKLSAIDVVISRVVRVDFPGVKGLEFRVVNWTLDTVGKGLRLELVEDHPDIWTGQPGDIVQPVLPGELNSRDPRSVQPVSHVSFTRTPDKLNQHGVLAWQGTAASYQVYLLDGTSIVWKNETSANLMPLTLPVADKPYTVEIVALNSFKVKSEAVAKTISLTLAAPKVNTTVLNTRDHWLEAHWEHTGAESYELELLTQQGKGVYRVSVNRSPVRLGWFHPGDYRLRVRGLLSITPSAWSDEVALEIEDLNGPTPVFMPEQKDVFSSGGMLSFSGKDPRTERIEYECTGPGFYQSGDCPGTPIRMAAMLPAVYQLRARAQWRDVYSGWQTVTQQVSENLSTPANLTFTEGDDPGLWGFLTWEANAGNYRVTVTRLSDGSTPIQTQVTSAEYQLPVLKVGRYQVTIIGLGRVDESEPATITLSLAAPSAPADVRYSPLEDDASYAGVVGWEPVASASGYQLRLSDGSGEILVESKTSDNRWLISPLTPGNYRLEVASISQREGAISDYSGVTFTLTGLKAPTGLTVDESLIGSGIQLISQVVLGCEPVTDARHYEFEYQTLGAGSWSGIQSGPAINATLNAMPPGTYQFRVRAVNGVRYSGYATQTFGVKGTERPPQPLKQLHLHGQSGSKASLGWELSSDPDVLTGGSIHVRHTHFIGEKASWDNASQVTDRLPGNATLAEVPLMLGTYLVKPVNAAGFYAETAAVAVSNMAGLAGYNRVVERVEPKTWPGVKNKAVVDVGGSLTMKASGVNNENPSYVLAQPLDLGAVITARVTMEVDASIYLEDAIDGRTDPIDSWPVFDGAIPDDVSLRYELSQTDDNPNSANARWSDWTPFIKGDFRGRGFRLRITLQGYSGGSAATISQLKLIADVPDRTEKGSHLNAPANGLRVTYTTPFLDDTPSIAITAHALPEKGRWVLSGQDRFGFNIRFYNGSSAIAAPFDYQTIGYGEAQ